MGKQELDPAYSEAKKKMEKHKKSLFRVPFDARFPNQNQTRNCWQNYVDYHRCQKIKGEDFEACDYFRKVFTTLCPQNWIDKWNDQRDEGIFAGEYYIEKP